MTDDRDERFLRRDQYAGPGNFEARLALHRRFSTAAEPWPRWAYARIDPVRFARVLDLGCGPAVLWRENADRPPRASRVILADLSEGMLAAARRVPAVASFAFVQASANDIPLRDASVDAVMANHMLYHVPDLDRALAEIRRVLAPGGRLFATTNGRRTLREIDALLQEIRPDGASLASHAAFVLQEGPGVVARHLTDVTSEWYPNHLEVTDPEAVVDYVASMVDARGLSAEERAVVRERVADEIAAHGHFHVTIEVGMVTATRAG